MLREHLRNVQLCFLRFPLWIYYDSSDFIYGWIQSKHPVQIIAGVGNVPLDGPDSLSERTLTECLL